MFVAWSWLITAAPALLTISSWESVPPEQPIAPIIAPCVDQWNAAARRDNSIEREQIVEMHQLDAVLEDLGWAPEGRGCSRLVFRYLN